jgi:hypothetical protein
LDFFVKGFKPIVLDVTVHINVGNPKEQPLDLALWSPTLKPDELILTGKRVLQYQICPLRLHRRRQSTQQLMYTVLSPVILSWWLSGAYAYQPPPPGPGPFLLKYFLTRAPQLLPSSIVLCMNHGPGYRPGQ